MQAELPVSPEYSDAIVVKEQLCYYSHSSEYFRRVIIMENSSVGVVSQVSAEAGKH
ncbi:MAG: hypothetical protein R2688_03505 [Fimbriimonadaceae bacterium]